MEYLIQKPGSDYTESGKFDAIRLILFTVIGYFVIGAIGVGYGLLTDLNPIIYLNLVILAISVFVLIFVIKLFTTFAKLRNRYISMCLGLFFGFVFTYNAWSAIYTFQGQSVFGGLFFQHSFSDLINLISMRNLSIGKLGRNGAGLGEELTSLIYVVEFLILTIIPAFMLVKDPSYYCEECDKEMSGEENYFPLDSENTTSIQSDLKQGKLQALFQLTALTEKQLKPNTDYIHLHSHTCPECNKLVFSATKGTAKMEKKESSFKKEQTLQQNIYGSKS